MISDELTLHYGQDRLLFDIMHQDHAIVAGVGYGKSDFGPKWLEYRRQFVNPKSQHFLIIAPTYRLLKKVCLSKYINFLEQVCGLRQGRSKASDFRVNWQDPSIIFRNGQEVIGVSGTDENALVAYTSANIWMDEAALLDREIRRRAIKRNRCPKATSRQILHTLTPEGMNWVYDLFNPEKTPREGVFSSNEKRLVLHGSSHDNPYLDEEYLGTLEEEFGWDQRYYQNYVLGWWVSLSRNAFYFAFDEKKNVGDVPIMKDLKDMILTFDFNVGKMSWSAIQQYALDFRVFKSNRSDGRNIDEACEQIKREFPQHEFRDWRVSVLGDASGYARSTHSYQTGYDLIEQNLKPHFPRLSIDAARSNPFVEERSRVTNKLLAETKLQIDRSCTKVIESAKSAETDHRRGIKKPADDDTTHAMEAVDMALMVLAPPKIRYESQGVVW